MFSTWERIEYGDGICICDDHDARMAIKALQIFLEMFIQELWLQSDVCLS